MSEREPRLSGSAPNAGNWFGGSPQPVSNGRDQGGSTQRSNDWGQDGSMIPGLAHGQSPGLEAQLADSQRGSNHSRQPSLSRQQSVPGQQSPGVPFSMGDVGGVGSPAPNAQTQPADPGDQMVSVKLSTLQKMQDELSHVMSTRGKANQELAETQMKLIDGKKMQKTLKAELDEALMHVGELAEGLELAESELDMLRPLEDNRARGLVSNELQWISGQLEKKFVMVGIECDEEMQLLKPKLREMESVTEELYEQVDILTRELSKANKLLGREDVVLLELEAVRHTALDTTREEIAVLREMIAVQKEEHAFSLAESRKEGGLRILQRISRRYIHRDSIAALRYWKEAQTGDQVASMKMSCSMISQLWRKMDRMSERAIEQESSVDGWREAVRTQETRVAVLTAHSSQLEDQLSRYQSSNVAMSDQGAEKEAKMREQIEEIENLRFKCSKADKLQDKIEAQEAEISTLIARLNRELRFSTANQDAVDADDQRMTQLSNRLRVQEAELANLNTVEAQYKNQIGKTREAKDELVKMRSELSQAEAAQRTAETQVRMLEVQQTEFNSKIDTLQVSQQTLHQSQADATGLREECSRATAALGRCQEDRDKLEEEIKMMRKNSEMSSKQVKRLQMLESLHDQDEVHIKAQKAENDRLQNVEKQLKTAQAKLDSQIEPLAKLPGLEVECREQKGRITSLTTQLSDLEETKTLLKQVNVRESKLQTRVGEQEAELEKQSTCWDKVKKAEQSLGKKQAEIDRLENVDGDLVQQRAKEAELEREVEKLIPFREKLTACQTELYRLKQEAEDNEVNQKKELKQLQDQTAKVEKQKQSAEQSVLELVAQEDQHNRTMQDLIARDEQDRERLRAESTEKVAAVVKQKDQSEAELHQLMSELKLLKATDMYKEMEKAKDQAAKLQRNVEGLQRDQMSMNGDQKSLLTANNKITELEEQISKLDLTKQRVVELETQCERLKAAGGAMLEEGHKFDSLNKASQRYKDTLVASEGKPRWSDPGASSRLAATVVHGSGTPETHSESLAATAARMRGGSASHDRAAKSQARQAAAAKKDKETAIIKERAAASAREDAEARKAAMAKKAASKSQGDITTRSTRSLEEQMEAYWGKKKGKNQAVRRSSIDETASRGNNNSTQASSGPSKTSAEWWGKPQPRTRTQSTQDPRSSSRSQSERLTTGSSLDSRRGGNSTPKENPQEIVSVGLAEWAGSAIRNSIPVDRPQSPQTPESPASMKNGWEWSAGAGSGSSESRDTSPVSPPSASRSPSFSEWGTGWSPARANSGRLSSPTRDSRDHTRQNSAAKGDDLTDLKAQIAQVSESSQRNLASMQSRMQGRRR